MGLYETQNRLGQSETTIFFSKNKFKVRFNKKSSCFILPRVSHSPVLPYNKFLVFLRKSAYWSAYFPVSSYSSSIYHFLLKSNVLFFYWLISYVTFCYPKFPNVATYHEVSGFDYRLMLESHLNDGRGHLGKEKVLSYISLSHIFFARSEAYIRTTTLRLQSFNFSDVRKCFSTSIYYIYALGSISLIAHITDLSDFSVSLSAIR
jgi:hypothetical protein